MAKSSTLPPEMVGPAIQAARAVLRDLAPTDTPAALRKVRASSARRLPPPLAKILVERLATDPWLREKVLDDHDAWDPDADHPEERASALLVLQPDGWEDALDELAAQRRVAEQTAQAAERDRRLESIEGELASSRAKVKQLRRQLAEERADSSQRQAELKAALAEQRRPLRDTAATDELSRLRAAHEQLAADLAEADRRIARLKAELLRARRSKTNEPSGVLRWGGKDPLDLARQLDSLATAVLPDAPEAATPSTGAAARFALPSGVAPDTPDAVAWLLERRRPTTLIVDGYNVTWLTNAETFATAEARANLVRKLRRLKRAALGPLRVIAVFDSRHGTTEPEHLGPVSVRFVESADDEIRRLAAETGGDVAVVSTDREVREGSEARGALVLWSEALVGHRL